MKQDKRRRLKPLKYMPLPEMKEKLTGRLKKNGWWFNSDTIASLCRIVKGDKS